MRIPYGRPLRPLRYVPSLESVELDRTRSERDYTGREDLVLYVHIQSRTEQHLGSQAFILAVYETPTETLQAARPILIRRGTGHTERQAAFARLDTLCGRVVVPRFAQALDAWLCRAESTRRDEVVYCSTLRHQVHYQGAWQSLRIDSLRVSEHSYGHHFDTDTGRNHPEPLSRLQRTQLQFSRRGTETGTAERWAVVREIITP